MIKRFSLGGLLLFAAGALHAQITLEQCVQNARDNYPLIKKYELLDRAQEISLSDINKGWLPQIGVYGQGSVQNAVPSFPDALSDMMAQNGTDMSGLGKLQYKVGAELNQMIWDGGASKSQREIVRADNVERQAQLNVQLYAIRERVENLFFGILLIDEQIKQTQNTQLLLQSNLDRLRSMQANGTAMQSDVDMLEAQCLSVSQQLIQAQSNSQSYRRMLGIFTGIEITGQELIKPTADTPDDMVVNRPEMALFDAQTLANEARFSTIKSGLMPKVGLFAQAYYGYPGFDNFKSMMNRDLSFNVLAGVKVSWNIGAFYTKNNRERQLQIASDGIAADRDIFLFNTSMQTQSQTDRIREIEDLMKEDARIVELRVNVRRAAESQLENGVIDATALLSKITDENQARLSASYHEIQLLQTIYQLKYTLNR